MIQKTKFSHKAMALFLTLAFMPSLLPINYLFASNNGPNAPEAASFEPVDATDMVNLVTGDMSYVLPLLNVPSPEGGYPVSLSYHAGIAMDQEASWTGLGWSLNPGAINRGVNGYPDDWGKANVSEFFYDVGFDEDFYNFSAGVTLGGAYSVGLGASWGSNQSLGGYVSASVGVGDYASVGGRIGTNGASLNGSIGGKHGVFSASVGTSGVGIGYGSKGQTSIGVGLNYNYSSGLSGGISVNQRNGSSKGLIKGTEIAKSVGMGINFSSSGVSANAKINGQGAGISIANGASSGGAIDVITSTTNFFLPIYMFYIGFGHTNRKYSLFKYSSLFTSGMLNPVEANSLKPHQSGSGLSRALKENHFMDVNVLPKFDRYTDLNDILSSTAQLDKNNLILPNYDNYVVTAQGLSGSLSPYIHSELNLSARGRGEQNTENIYTSYLNHSIDEYSSPNTSPTLTPPNTDAIQKVNFTMSNAYNSFLRMETSNIFEEANLPAVDSDHIMDYFKTTETSSFDNTYSLTNGPEKRKREGNYIETFTNKQIRESYTYTGSISSIPNFIDAEGLYRNDVETFLDEGIGAYKITTVDGKTYHYSLPVYNFETFYKNFKNELNEDANFFEIQKTTPYATHWLLTAVTGPDYVDVNSDGKVNQGDYGYWVDFDYGKWSDGYVWQTPNGRLNEDVDRSGKTTYSYSWGRKQIYYLDAIKTRTHTALFVKDLRDDNKSISNPKTYNQKWTSGTFDPVLHASSKIRSKRLYWVWNQPNFSSTLVDFYDKTGNKLQLPLPANNGCNADGDFVTILAGRETVLSYLDAPKTSSLKLSKVILLRNSDAVFDKSKGNFSAELNGVSYNNKAYLYNNSHIDNPASACAKPDYFINPHKLRQFKSHLDQNVLDAQDINGLNLEAKAQQVISFVHDYSMAQGSPNSDANGKGRLSLKKVNFKGKQGIQKIPPYKFSYQSAALPYNEDDIDDWGYHTTVPQVWSLSEIQMPTGSKIKVGYEPDSYYAEAAFSTERDFNVKSIDVNNDILTYNLNSAISPTEYFVPGDYYDTSFNLTQHFTDNQVTCCDTNESTGVYSLEVLSTSANTVTLRDNTGFSGDLLDYDQNCTSPTHGTICIYNINLIGRIDNLTISDNNGKKGGGLRVKYLEVTDGSSKLTTEYSYTNPDSGKITGITSYAPSKFAKAIPYASELPSPMVLYGNVKMETKDNNDASMGWSSYEFETLEPYHDGAGYAYSLGNSFKVMDQQNPVSHSNKVISNKYTIFNNLGSIGRLLSVSSYNNKGHLLNKNSNQYKANLDTDGEIGVTQESHKSYKRVLKTANLDEYFYISSTSRVNYPSVLESSTTTQGGVSYTSYYDKYDFLTGQALNSTTTDSKNRAVISTTIPAYSIVQYNPAAGYGMGSKADNPTNKNMLVQEAMSKTYINTMDNSNLIGANITTWSPTTFPAEDGVWRKHKTFIWDGNTNSNGIYKNFTQDYDNFNWDLEENRKDVVQPSHWKQISEISMYDDYSMSLEVIDINGNKAATKMDDKDSKVIASGNAGYYSLAYKGAEKYEKGSLSLEDGRYTSQGRTDEMAHTGKYSLKVTTEKGFYTGFWSNTPGVYRISVWASKENYQNARVFDGTSLVEFNKEEVFAGDDWVMLNHEVELNSKPKEIHVSSVSGTIFFDDFRIHPVASTMTSYVYNEWDELTHILGPNNMATRYEYDEMGRLEYTYSEVIDFDQEGSGGFKKTSKNQYTYKY